MQASWASYTLDFKFLAQTSRESMRQKSTYFVSLKNPNTSKVGIGECALFKGLSADDRPDYEHKLQIACDNPLDLPEYSSIRFGMETALINAGIINVPDTKFTQGEDGIQINGLIWMGSRDEMRVRINEKLANGFSVLKLKIGGIDFKQEVELLRYIRSQYSSEVLELRLDANGSFSTESALEKLKYLSDFEIHSIEQPIRAGQPEKMQELCRLSPIDIALDEELIGVHDADQCFQLLNTIKPQYIILKPSLCGGLSGADLWADTAEKLGIGWWATSALESNVGLFAIARWVSARNVKMPQGLGTGLLYHNNVESPLYLKGDRLYFNPEGKWIYPQLKWHR